MKHELHPEFMQSAEGRAAEVLTVLTAEDALLQWGTTLQPLGEGEPQPAPAYGVIPPEGYRMSAYRTVSEQGKSPCNDDGSFSLTLIAPDNMPASGWLADRPDDPIQLGIMLETPNGVAVLDVAVPTLGGGTWAMLAGGVPLPQMKVDVLVGEGNAASILEEFLRLGPAQRATDASKYWGDVFGMLRQLLPGDGEVLLPNGNVLLDEVRLYELCDFISLYFGVHSRTGTYLMSTDKIKKMTSRRHRPGQLEEGAAPGRESRRATETALNALRRALLFRRHHSK